MTQKKWNLRDFRLKTVPFLALLALTALFRSTQNAFQTTIGPIGHSILDLTPSVIGIGIALAGAVNTLASLWLAMRLRSGHLRLIAMAALTSILAAILVIEVGGGIYSFLVSAVIFGASGGLAMPVLATLASRVEGVSRDRAISAYTVALSASLALGPFFESIVLKVTHDSLKSGLSSFLPFPLAALVFLSLVKPSLKSSMASTGDRPFSGHISRNPHFRMAIVALLLYQVPFIAITSFGALMAHYVYHATIALAQLCFTVFFVVSLSTRSVLVWRPPGRHEYTLLRISAALTLIGTLVLAVGHGLVSLFAAMVLLGIPHGLVYPVSISTVARTTTPKDVPRANATLAAATSAASVISPFLLGEVATFFGYRAISVFTLVPVALLAVFLFLINPSKPPETSSPTLEALPPEGS